ncbi:DNA-processing protein DprA [Sediminispirochaeta smaragdinae]|uniref:DNA protecting protein DprA n=1 Tax=Sediminispirochaeta smaragdinae (strain DSM 11293 / JCM 15392 / SEBR 4228) TaxID=573413 RepID=E1R5R7_SEDSS|nr:DNA-processing protein DprA [Sediminispirochaeta smaragdinae]ADK80682.1 DNA protecting protein DprA [Sediminispirochaeta smaragdinae DSM 11293]
MNDIRFDVGISLLPGLRSAERLMLSEIIPDLRELLRLGRFDLQALIGRRLHFENEQLLNIEKDIEEVIQGVKALGASIISYWDSRYPVLLREIYDPPYLLYLRGSLPAPADPAVAVVGTRKDDPSSIAAAFSFSAELALSSVPVVSGLARGIDRAAHEGALSGGGYTLAVLGSGVDRIYPEAHHRLAERILAEGGGLVSEYPPGTAPLRFHFPARNRIISGICRSTVVIAAPTKSGALITADYALEQGRDLFVHRCGVEREAFRGTLHLERDGATVLEHGSDLLRYWGRDGCRTIVGGEEAREPSSFARLVRQEIEGDLFFYSGTWFSAFQGDRKNA